MPPNPLDWAAVGEYKALGFTHCILTEDNVKFTENGKITKAYSSAIKNIEQSGMGVFVRNMYNDSDYFCNAENKFGSNYGTPYFMEKRNVKDELKGVFGFYMADEPYMRTQCEMPWRYANKEVEKFSAFDKLVKLAEWKNEYYPNAFFHVNHVPSLCYDHFFPSGEKIYDYKDFLNAYVKTVIKKLKGGIASVCIDNYPFVGKGRIESDYLSDLLTAATVTQKYNSRATKGAKAVFGMCVQTFRARAIDGTPRSRDIEHSGEITFQLYAGAALGARLYEYFCYKSAKKLAGIIAKDGSRRLYSLVQKANERALGLCETAANFEWKGAFACAGSVLCDNAAAFIRAKSMFCKERRIKASGEYDLLVGCFENSEAYGYLAVNYVNPESGCKTP